MGRLLVFNPEHDYALANNHKNYFPPAGIRTLAQSMRLLPIVEASEEDFILLPENIFVSACDLRPLDPARCQEKINHIDPWGWNLNLRSRLKGLGISPLLLPDEEYLDNLRRLSHRRISILLNQYLGNTEVAREFFSEEEAMYFKNSLGECCFKAPWSSSGRGIMFTTDLQDKVAEEWIHGVISKQGSILAEPIYEKHIDLASLWDIKNGKASFRGLSISQTDNRGRYLCNLFGPQNKFRTYLKKYSDDVIDETLDRQQNFLDTEIAPYYTGKAGIDMLIETDRKLRSGIELNLRKTMGHYAMDLEERREILCSHPNIEFRSLITRMFKEI